MRSRAFQESAQESLLRERELREAQTELERCRVERDDWERVALQEKAISEESKSAVEMFKRDLERVKIQEPQPSECMTGRLVVDIRSKVSRCSYLPSRSSLLQTWSGTTRHIHFKELLCTAEWKSIRLHNSIHTTNRRRSWSVMFCANMPVECLFS